MNIKPTIVAVLVAIALAAGLCSQASGVSIGNRSANTVSDKTAAGNGKVGVVAVVTAVLAVSIVVYMRMALKGVAGQRQTVRASRVATDEAVRTVIERRITAAVDSVHNAWLASAHVGDTDTARMLQSHEKDLRTLREKIVYLKFQHKPKTFRGMKTSVDAINDIAVFESNIRDLTITLISSAQRVAEDIDEGRNVSEHLETVTGCVYELNEQLSRHNENVHGPSFR